jgi:branched-chain amino acid transport system permease protein
MDLLFFAKVLIGGLLSGVMYSLVALGYVLIFKASGVFNFAQGSMVLFAAMTFAGLVAILGSRHPGDLIFWIALVITLVVMVGVAIGTERFVLRPLVNQPLIILFLATLGLSYLLEGTAQGVWGAVVRPIEIGIPERPVDVLAALGLSASPPTQAQNASIAGPSESSAPASENADEGLDDIKIETVEIAVAAPRSGLSVSQFDLFAAVIAGVLVISLATFFNYTRVGRALRAVADDHQAALSVGIPLQFVWSVVWAAAGIVALVAGLLWGARIGGQFLLTFVALKALPVLIIGGFTSISGAIVGGLIVGAIEKLAEAYIGPFVGGGVESWFAYAAATVFLLFLPQGLFGEKLIQRV